MRSARPPAGGLIAVAAAAIASGTREWYAHVPRCSRATGPSSVSTFRWCDTGAGLSPTGLIRAQAQVAPSAPTSPISAFGCYVGCIAGALSRSGYGDGLAAVGFVDVEITFTRRGGAGDARGHHPGRQAERGSMSPPGPRAD